jgi:gamma-glutamyltranspeptidase/glutathione hydrolase
MLRNAVVLFLLAAPLSACERPSPAASKSSSQVGQPAVDGQRSQPPSPPSTSTEKALDAEAKAISPALRDLPKVSSHQIAWGRDEKVYGKNGVVTSVDRSATQAGIEILERGGNAVDAAVATALALAVTHPSAGNLGGGGFLLLKIGTVVEAVDFREDSPSALTHEVFWKMIREGGRGPASVGIPGTVSGLHLAHSRRGRLPWKEVVAPAERLARQGYELGERQAKTIAWAAHDLILDDVARSLFFSEGKAKKVNTIIRRPGLATALQRIAQFGPAGFYEGPTAQDLVASLGKEGLMTLDDLKGYRAKLRIPLFFDFGEYRIITMPAPSAGGVALAQSLLILQQSGVATTEENSPRRLHLIAEASRRAQAERQFFVVSPDGQSDSELRAIRKRVLDPKTWLEKHPIEDDAATLSSSLHEHFKVIDNERKHTTHLSVIDGEGGLVSCTVTLSGSFGALILSKETGIVFNNSVASFSSVGSNTPRPSQRTTSSMAPTFALRGEDQALVLGSPGGDTIPSTVAQTFLHLSLDGDPLSKAIEKPRFHQGFAPQEVSMERLRPLPEIAQKALRKSGHAIQARHAVIGDANIAARIGDTSFAVADAREGGSALAARAIANPATPEGQR